MSNTNTNQGWHSHVVVIGKATIDLRHHVTIYSVKHAKEVIAAARSLEDVINSTSVADARRYVSIAKEFDIDSADELVAASKILIAVAEESQVSLTEGAASVVVANNIIESYDKGLIDEQLQTIAIG